MDFGEALKVLKAGGRVAREGWNGKGMWISMTSGRQVHADDLWSQHNQDFANTKIGRTVKVQSCITMKTASNEIQMGWLASQSDMLSDDWVEVH